MGKILSERLAIVRKMILGPVLPTDKLSAGCLASASSIVRK